MDLKFPDPKFNPLCITAYVLISNANPLELGGQRGHSGTYKTRSLQAFAFSVVTVNDEHMKLSFKRKLRG